MDNKKTSFGYIQKFKMKGQDSPKKEKLTMNNMLKSFLITKWKEIQYDKLMKNYDDYGKTYEELLIDEIKKPPNDILNINHNNNPNAVEFYLKHIKKFEENMEKEKDENRDAKKITILMKQLPGLVKFMKFNGLDDELLNLASNYVEHAYFPKGTYIFKQGEQSRRFYGIITGKVSIRIRNNNSDLNQFITKGTIIDKIKSEKFSPSKILASFSDTPIKNTTICTKLTQMTINTHYATTGNTTPYVEKVKENRERLFKSLMTENNCTEESDQETEVMRVSKGMCFGEWAVIYNIPRTASAYTLEDTELFYLDKECFDRIFSKAISKADYDKKNFLVKRIPSLKLAGKVHDILKKIIPIFCDNKRVIYTQFDPADYIYLVYQGECKIQNFFAKITPKNKEDVIHNQDKLVTCLILEKGGIAGLEIAENCKNYKYNLVCNKDQTIIYKISVKVLKEFNKEILEYLLPIYKEYEQLINNFIDRYEEMSRAVKPDYKQKILKYEKLSMSEIKIKELEEQNKIKKTIEEAKLIKKSAKNEFKVLNIDAVKKEEGYYLSSKKAKDLQNDKKKRKLASLSTIKPISFRIENLFVDSAKREKKHLTKQNTFNVNVFVKKNSIQANGRNFFHRSQVEKNSAKEKSLPFNQNLFLDQSISNPVLTDGNTNTTKPSVSGRDTFSYINMVTNSEGNLPNKKFNFDPQINPRDKINEIEEIHSRKVQIFKPSIKINFNSLRADKPEKKNLTKWNNSIKNNSLYFDSGMFNLPLISFNLNKTRDNCNTEY